MLFAFFAQFISHDINFVSKNKTEEISTPQAHTMRSSYGGSQGPVIKNTVNKVSSFIDCSQIYGSNEQSMKRVREFRGGRIKMIDNMLIRDLDGTFFSGDTRVNDNIGLTSIHTIFVREHNRLC